MTPDTLGLPPLPQKYRWRVLTDPTSHPRILLQRRRRLKWRTIGFSYVMTHYTKPGTLTPASIGQALYREHLARRTAGLD